MCVAYTAMLNGKQVVLKTPLPNTSHAEVAANDLEVGRSPGYGGGWVVFSGAARCCWPSTVNSVPGYEDCRTLVNFQRARPGRLTVQLWSARSDLVLGCGRQDDINIMIRIS